MKLSVTTSALWLASLASASPAKGTLAGPELKHWPREAAAALDKMISRNAHNGSYAVFDMDNTSYKNDIEEVLLPYMENRGILTRDTMDPFLKLIPFRDIPSHNESLYSYYARMCEVDDNICYSWVAEMFSGFTLRELKGYVDEVMALNGTVPGTLFVDTSVPDDELKLQTVDIPPPRVFRGQVELYNRLMANGIDVYVITAASEDLVRMIAADPKYGYNVPPQNVIGISVVLKNKQGDLTTVRKQVAAGNYTAAVREENLDSVMIPYMWNPGTWAFGKWDAILKYIDQWKKPILAGGDTPSSDGPMIFHGVDVARGGIHLFIERSNDTRAEMDDMIDNYTKRQGEEGLPVTADKNWVFVTQDDLSPTH